MPEEPQIDVLSGAAHASEVRTVQGFPHALYRVVDRFPFDERQLAFLPDELERLYRLVEDLNSFNIANVSHRHGW